jgi:hypothetical protein
MLVGRLHAAFVRHSCSGNGGARLIWFEVYEPRGARRQEAAAVATARQEEAGTASVDSQVIAGSEKIICRRVRPRPNCHDIGRTA